MGKRLLLFVLLFGVNYSFGQNVNMWNSSWTPSFRNLRAVQIIAGDKLVAVGGWEANDSITTILTSSNKGLSWNLVTDNLNAILQDLQFPTDTLGYCVGWDGNIWKTSNAGELTVPGNPGTRNYNGC